MTYLFSTPLDQAQIDFENEGGETYICGNPPYAGSKKREKKLTDELGIVLSPLQEKWKDNDYVAGWFVKSAQYIAQVPSVKSALVTTNSISQGLQVDLLWPLIFKYGIEIGWAYTSFKWSNLATNKATVTVVIIGDINEMLLGNVPKDGGNLLFSEDEAKHVPEGVKKYLLPIFGSQEFIRGFRRFCLWISDDESTQASDIPFVKSRLESVAKMRMESTKGPTREWARKPYRFVEIRSPKYLDVMIIPRVSSESRDYLPVGFLSRGSVVLDSAFALYDAPLWNMAIIASKMHLVWIATVCGKLETDFRYSNTLGWNTFPVPSLTEKNKADLTRCAEDILLAREAHFPATIADLYDPDNMPENLRHAHERNDEVLERIYIGRRFKNDTERLEKLFELYTKMTTEQKKPPKKAKAT
jgi:hypothetical protein